MAQLIKIQDYTTRYAMDPYRYPSRFMKLKQQNWLKMKHAWDFYQRGGMAQEDAPPLLFTEGVIPATETELKQHFLDGLLPFQLKWASRTLTDKSFLDHYYYTQHALLKYFLQRFPDTYLFMFEPIFQIKKAPIETNHLLIHPQAVYCIEYMDFQEDVTLIPENDRTWYQEVGNEQTRMLSPQLSLKRSSRIVKSILRAHQIDIPVLQIVLAPNHRIHFHHESYETQFIGEVEYEQWFTKMRNYQSPLKSIQLKTIATLLKHTQTTSVRRPEWEVDDNNPLIDEGIEEK
ncbi:nuclease-related domain-containing protein [Pontibacillus litoralis]|uniref:NERD domain-containing protein n=1 Tax=Pontibacillus litoralis JSM 072002 TaxID=1385512 RepID=A0A0A5HZY3_9BACI|nr:nuclease-related domain-containing protein [Pontibacillus litoralis]KGX89167.1 hypothetical protein N784_02240 [Pontibacillus litoralis JSM 072002]